MPRSKQEQWLYSGSYFVEHGGGSPAYEPRSPLLPRGTAQLIRLHEAADLVVVRYRDVKAPITVTCGDRAGDAPPRQFVESQRRGHKRGPPSRPAHWQLIAR